MEDLKEKEKETSSKPEISFKHNSVANHGKLIIAIEYDGKLFHNNLPNGISIKMNKNKNDKKYYSLISGDYSKISLIENNSINIFKLYNSNDFYCGKHYSLKYEIKGILYFPNQMSHNEAATELKLIGYESIKNPHSPGRHSSQIYGDWSRRVSNPGIGSDIKLYYDKRWKQYFPDSCYIKLDDIEKGNIPGFTEYKELSSNEEERKKAVNAIINNTINSSEDNKKIKGDLIKPKSSMFDEEDNKIADDIINGLIEPENNNEFILNTPIPKGIPLEEANKNISECSEEEKEFDPKSNKDNIEINNFIPNYQSQQFVPPPNQSFNTSHQSFSPIPIQSHIPFNSAKYSFESQTGNNVVIGKYKGFYSISINLYNKQNIMGIAALTFRNAVIKHIKILNITDKNIFISCNISGYKKIHNTNKYKIIDIYSTIVFDLLLNLVDYQMISVDKYNEFINTKLKNEFRLKILI